ncbi:MAG: lysophospholipid acyltransferase family protein [Anaerolineales bacterium]|nr:lysophospholipid acyltransferase family protein [Anaerolineales bacterium]
MDIWYQSLKALIGLYSTLFQGSVHVLGRDNLPEGPKILIGNHANVTDGFILPYLVKEKLHFFVQEEFFSIKILGPVFIKAEQIPVVKGEGRKAIDAAKACLERGNSVVVFPEGELNHGKDFHRGRTGAVVLASESKVPLVPMGFYVPDRYMKTLYSNHYNRRTQGRWQFGGPLFVNVGHPKQVPGNLSEENNYRELRHTSARIMEYVSELVEQARANADRVLKPRSRRI